MKAIFQELDALSAMILNNHLGKSEPWQGADVVITDHAIQSSAGNFYPDPRFVVTPYVAELSWLFEQLVQVFSSVDGYGAWKEELFGRFGNMANRAASLGKANSPRDLLLAVLHEAYSCAEEIQEGNFRFLMVTTGNSIYEDLITKAMLADFKSESEVEKYLRSKGLLS